MLRNWKLWWNMETSGCCYCGWENDGGSFLIKKNDGGSIFWCHCCTVVRESVCGVTLRAIWSFCNLIEDEMRGIFVLCRLSEKSGVLLFVHTKFCWLRLPLNQSTVPRKLISDVTVIKWAEGLNFKWLNFVVAI